MAKVKAQGREVLGMQADAAQDWLAAWWMGLAGIPQAFSRAKPSDECTDSSPPHLDEAALIEVGCEVLQVPGSDLKPAMLVNTFNVTDQKEAEEELAAARLQLIR